MNYVVLAMELTTNWRDADDPWLEVGETITDYTVTNKIVTSLGRTDERSIYILCKER